MEFNTLIYDLIFYLFAIVTIVSAGIVAFSKNVMHSALALLLTFFGVAAFYVYMGAAFLAVSQIVIYVGGVLVLIIFAVMLTHSIKDVEFSNPASGRFLGLIIAGAVAAGLIFIITKSGFISVTNLKVDNPVNVWSIGEALVTDYLLPFEVASILLLASLIGAVYLARKNKNMEKE